MRKEQVSRVLAFRESSAQEFLVVLTEFSVVMPVHNEARFLPYSLPSVYQLKPSEVIVLLDNCSNGSEKIVKEYSAKFGMTSKTRVINPPMSDGWRMRFAFLRFLGCSLAGCPVVLVTGADVVLDSLIRRYLDILGEKVKFVSFGYVDYPFNWRNRLRRLLTVFLPREFGENWLTGIQAFFVKEAFEVEDLEELKQIESAEDTLLHCAFQQKYRTEYLRTDTIHLRPREGSRRHYLRGKLYWNVAHRGWLVTLVNGVLFLRLNLIRGYIHARFGGKK